MHSPDESYPEVLEKVISQLVTEGRDAAHEALRPIAYPAHAMPLRPALSRSTRLAIYQRDGWLCRYCGAQTIFTPVMALLARVFPDEFPYHPNWKIGATHPAIMSRSAAMDHILPGAHGGSWTDRENLATACWLCNARKADLTLNQLGWTLREVPGATGWDGLTRWYPQLWEVAGSPGGEAAAWKRALAGSRRVEDGQREVGSR